MERSARDDDSILGFLNAGHADLTYDGDLWGRLGDTYFNQNSRGRNKRASYYASVAMLFADRVVFRGSSTFGEINRYGFTSAPEAAGSNAGTVSAVPLPAAAWFLITAVAGLFGMGWLKARRAPV